MLSKDIQMDLIADALENQIALGRDVKIKEWFSFFKLSDGNLHALVYKPTRTHLSLTYNKTITGAPNGRNKPIEYVLSKWFVDELNRSLISIGKTDLIAEGDVKCPKLLFGKTVGRVTSAPLDCVIIQKENKVKIDEGEGLEPEDLIMVFEFKVTITMNFEFDTSSILMTTPTEGLFPPMTKSVITSRFKLDPSTYMYHGGSTSLGRSDNTKKALGTAAEFRGGWDSYYTNLKRKKKIEKIPPPPPFIVVGSSPPSPLWLLKLQNATYIDKSHFIKEIWELNPLANSSMNYCAIITNTDLDNTLKRLLP